MHAVSVGETRAAAPLIALLRRDHPGASILLTHMTPTGRATGRELFGDSVTQAWLPWDYRFAARRFLAAHATRVRRAARDGDLAQPAGRMPREAGFPSSS